MHRPSGIALILGLALSACSTFTGGEPSPPDNGPPLVNGYYVEPGDRCGEACPTFGKWRATGPCDVFADAQDRAEVIATIVEGDVVTTTPGQTVVRPLRGTVQKAGGGLNPGDVVYQLLGDGEGFSYDVWRNGEVLNVDADGDNAPVIQWDERPDNAPPSAWWVRVELTNGTKGWLRNPSSFDGMGPLS
jgi:hypothetical protein